MKACTAIAVLICAFAARAEDTFRELRWRSVGPYRGGRTKAAAGVPGKPGLFYVGAVNGGVWRTDDYGRTWTPIFDGQPTGSIGAIAVAPSNPDVIYVGSGECLQRPDLSTGDGVYKSTDGGKTWRHLGLRDAQQIPQIAVDPRDPDRLFVAVLGHPYGPNEERGVFRSVDGGATFQKVLYRDPDTGAADVLLDPSDPGTVFAALWESREGPWENGHFEGPGSGLYKSTDGGSTWRRLAQGLPDFEHGGLGRIGIGIAPSSPRRLFVTVAAKTGGGLFRSDDAGENWSRVTDDERVAERADDFAEVKVHPRNPDVVFTASVVVWKSTDGGKTFTALRGAPGGDDYHRIWIDPVNPDVMLLAGDQGAIVTVNGGSTWSSWYNQPTAQMFHVTADSAFPYRLCGGQQESGSACVSSRGSDGEITFREWHPAGFEEYGYGAPDPLDPDIVDGGKSWRDVTPPDLRPWAKVSILEAGHYDARTAYAAINTLRLDDLRPHIYRTHDGGKSWQPIVNGLPDGGIVNVVREDPARKGLLYCGTEQAVYVSFDDGDRWEPLRLNMPATSIRDLIVKDKDLAVATHGRGFWILDDISPLRQFPTFAAGRAALLRPAPALRVRFDTNTDTPVPPDEPAGKNPPDGAIFDYWLAQPASGPVILEILDESGRAVRRWSS